VADNELRTDDSSEFYNIFVVNYIYPEMKKSIFAILFVILIISCKREIEVTSIDQIPGLWRWEYTCGGDEFECIYGSKSNYATIDFKTDGSFIEKHNDTLYLKTNYTIIDHDGTYGTLILENPEVHLPIAIVDKSLIITRVSFTDTYTKIK
jgi:hypothetical protein